MHTMNCVCTDANSVDDFEERGCNCMRFRIDLQIFCRVDETESCGGKENLEFAGKGSNFWCLHELVHDSCFMTHSPLLWTKY